MERRLYERLLGMSCATERTQLTFVPFDILKILLGFCQSVKIKGRSSRMDKKHFFILNAIIL